jgi:hypothetical protein
VVVIPKLDKGGPRLFIDLLDHANRLRRRRPRRGADRDRRGLAPARHALALAPTRVLTEQAARDLHIAMR